MAKKSILLAIFLLSATPAMADDIVRIRSDGKMIDEVGHVIAVPSVNDSRNDDYKRYYKNLDAKGNPISANDFYIVNDPLKGLVKVTASSKPGTSSQAQSAPQQKNGMVTQYNGSQTLIKSPDAPIYNDVNNNIETVY